MLIAEPHKSWVEFAQGGPQRKMDILSRGEAYIGYMYCPTEDITAYQVALIQRYNRDIESGYAHPELFSLVKEHYQGVELYREREPAQKPKAQKKRAASKKQKDEGGDDGV